MESILESLEELNVSEECFDEIIDILEEFLFEGEDLRDNIKRQVWKKYDNGEITKAKAKQLLNKAMRVIPTKGFYKTRNGILKRIPGGRATHNSHGNCKHFEWRKQHGKGNKYGFTEYRDNDVYVEKSKGNHYKKLLKKQINPEIKKLEKESAKVEASKKAALDDVTTNRQIANAVNKYSQSSDAKNQVQKDSSKAEKVLANVNKKLSDVSSKKAKAYAEQSAAQKKATTAANNVHKLINKVEESLCECIDLLNLAEGREPGESLADYKERLKQEKYSKFLPNLETRESQEKSRARNIKKNKKKIDATYKKSRKLFNDTQKSNAEKKKEYNTSKEILQATEKMYGSDHPAYQTAGVKHLANAVNYAKANSNLSKAGKLNKEIKSQVKAEQEKVDTHNKKAEDIRNQIKKADPDYVEYRADNQKEIRGEKTKESKKESDWKKPMKGPFYKTVRDMKNNYLY